MNSHEFGNGLIVLATACFIIGGSCGGIIASKHYERAICNNEPIEVTCTTTKTISSTERK